MAQSTKFIIFLLVVGLLGVLYYFIQSPPREINPISDTTSESSSSVPVSSNKEVVVSNPKPASTNTVSPVSPPSSGSATSFILTPSKGESWTLGKTHEIRWNKNSGAPGSIALVNASNDSIVGWIAPSITAREVAYNWDTLNVHPDQTDPTKKNVAPGTYYIQAIFSGNKGAIRSDNFNLISGENENILTTKVKIANRLFSPNFISINKGQKVIIINDNQNDNETILMGGVVIEVLSPRHSYLIDTSKMSSGEVEVRLASNAIAKLTLSIK